MVEDGRGTFTHTRGEPTLSHHVFSIPVSSVFDDPKSSVGAAAPISARAAVGSSTPDLPSRDGRLLTYSGR